MRRKLVCLGLTAQKVWILGVGRSGTRSYEVHLLGRVAVVRIDHISSIMASSSMALVL